jgi:hypothetical protein
MTSPDIPGCACPACGKRYRPASHRPYRAPDLPVNAQTKRPPKVWQAIGGAKPPDQ